MGRAMLAAVACLSGLASLLVVAVPAPPAEPQPGCWIDLPVYDETGVRLPYWVESVVPKEVAEKERNDPGWLARNGFKPRISGCRVFGLTPGLRYVASFRDSNGENLKREFALLYTCVQRASQVVVTRPEKGSIGDVAHDQLDGRLEGCTFDGDWWVRIAPIHGQDERTYEGAVKSEGTFAVPGNYSTSRYALLIGHERDIVATFAIDVRYANQPIQLGTFNLAGSSPKSQ